MCDCEQHDEYDVHCRCSDCVDRRDTADIFECSQVCHSDMAKLLRAYLEDPTTPRLDVVREELARVELRAGWDSKRCAAGVRY
jgi:hypothetical protein